ncbi:MAG TPA: hypothetical protein DCM39_11580 [Pantoea sp.]|nr:hypothetical protein [Pantoea sp.]
MRTAQFAGRTPGFSLPGNTVGLLVGKTLLHGDVLMWLRKTLLTSGCTNHRGARQNRPALSTRLTGCLA